MTLQTAQVYRTDVPLVASLPLAYTVGADGHGLYQYRTVAQVDIGDLQAGDVLAIAASGEVTVPTTLTDNVMLGRLLKVSTTDSPDFHEGFVVADPMTVNTNLTRRHETMPVAANVQVTGDMVGGDGLVHVLFVMYAASLTGPVNAASLMFNYADLSVQALRFREVTP